MENSKRRDLCQELKTLLDKWLALPTSPEYTLQEYETLRRKILEICDLLDEMSR